MPGTVHSLRDSWPGRRIPRHMPGCAIHRVKLVGIEFSAVEQLATGRAPIVVLTRAMNSHHQIPMQRIKALSPPLAALGAGEKPFGNAIGMSACQPLRLFGRRQAASLC